LTVDSCDPVRGCVSTPLAGIEGVGCRLEQLASPDTCSPGDIDARTEAAIAKRVGSALKLLDKASQASGGARRKLLGRIARQLGSVRRRVSRVAAGGTLPAGCAATLDGLAGSAQDTVRVLADEAQPRRRKAAATRSRA
jgi:hypothetical protein